MKRYYISFGQNHSHLLEGHHFFKDNLATFTTPSYDAARELAFKLFGGKSGASVTSMIQPYPNASVASFPQA